MDRNLICLRNASFPELYFNFEAGLLVKNYYSVIASSWSFEGTALKLAYPSEKEVSISVLIEYRGDYVKLKLPDQDKYYDVYDGEIGEIELWSSSQSLNQCWIVESGSPVEADQKMIKSQWSPSVDLRVAQQMDYDCLFRLRQNDVRTFRYPEAIDPRAALIHIPLVDVNGDRYVKLTDGKRITFDKASAMKYRLLNYRERRLARKMVVASNSLCFAKGGLHDSQVILHKRPFPLIILSIAGAQFEFRNLEFQDFIVKKGDKAIENPLFPHYYRNEIKPSFEEAQSLGIAVGDDCLLLTKAYRISIMEDLFLILFAFNAMIPEGRKGCFRMVGFGLGFFAYLDMQYSLTPILTEIFIKALDLVLKAFHSHFPQIVAIDFSTQKGEGSLAPPASGNYGHIQIKERNSDLLDPPTDELLIGVVNPSDVFSYKGNEFSYDSVEALLGNNTDLRYNQVLIFNPALEKRDRHQIVTRPCF